MWEILTNLTFERYVALALVLVPALFNIYVLYYLNHRLQPSETSRTFAFTIRALLIWQLRDCMFRLSNSAETAYYWDNILSSGYLVFAPVNLLFTLKYTGYERKSKHVGILFLLFLPALFFQSIYGLISMSVHYYLSPFWGWNHSYSETLTGKSTAAWVFICGMISCTLLIRYAWRCRNVPILSNQSLLVAAGRTLLWLVAFVTQFYIPQVIHHHVIPLTSTISVIYSLAILIAIRRFRLFQMLESEEAAKEDKNTQVAQLTLSPDFNVIQANSFANHALDLHFPAPPVPASKILENTTENRHSFDTIISECMAGKLVTNKELHLDYKRIGPKEETISASPVYKDHRLEKIVLVWRNTIQ